MLWWQSNYWNLLEQQFRFAIYSEKLPTYLITAIAEFAKQVLPGLQGCENLSLILQLMWLSNNYKIWWIIRSNNSNIAWTFGKANYDVLKSIVDELNLGYTVRVISKLPTLMDHTWLNTYRYYWTSDLLSRITPIQMYHIWTISYLSRNYFEFHFLLDLEKKAILSK